MRIGVELANFNTCSVTLLLAHAHNRHPSCDRLQLLYRGVTARSRHHFGWLTLFAAVSLRNQNMKIAAIILAVAACAFADGENLKGGANYYDKQFPG